MLGHTLRSSWSETAVKKPTMAQLYAAEGAVCCEPRRTCCLWCSAATVREELAAAHGERRLEELTFICLGLLARFRPGGRRCPEQQGAALTDRAQRLREAASLVHRGVCGPPRRDFDGVLGACAALWIADRTRAAWCGLTFELTPTAAAGRLGPGGENVPRTSDRAKVACRSGSGVERGVRPSRRPTMPRTTRCGLDRQSSASEGGRFSGAPRCMRPAATRL